MSNPFSLELHCSVRLPIHLPQPPLLPPPNKPAAPLNRYTVHGIGMHFRPSICQKHLRLSYLPVTH